MFLSDRSRRILMAALLASLLGPWPATAQSPQPTLDLTLQQAMRMAFENNLDIRVVAYDRMLADEQVTTAEGTFEPVFTFGTPGAGNFLGLPGSAAFGGALGAGGLGYSNLRQPSSTALAGADVSKNRGFAGLLNFGQTLPVGFHYDVSYNVSRTTTNSLFQSLNPAWDNTIALTVSQPLLRGRGREGSAAALLIARASTAVSEAAFRAQVEDILLRVESAYWQQVFAERDLQVKQASLDLAHEQLERTSAQVEVGLIAPVEQTQAEVQVAARETDLIVARNALDDARDALRALLRADRLPDGWETMIQPVDDPGRARPGVSLEEAVSNALENRPEVRQAQAAVAVEGIRVDAGRDALQPRFDLVAQVATNGIGGDLIVREGFPGEIIDVVPGGYGDALSQLFGMDYVSWRVGFNVSVPIGNSTAEGNYAQATINEDRAKSELERTRQQVVLDARQAWRAVQAASDRVESTRKTRELAERQLEIETDRFDVGMSTNFEVLQFQEDLTEARSAELQAMIQQRIAETQLRRAMGLLLDQYAIHIQ